jgi:hypothetical protein
LDDEGRGQDLAENLAVLPDRRDKPGQIEGAIGVVESQPRLDQQQLSRSDRFKLLPIESLWALLARIACHDMTVAATAADAPGRPWSLSGTSANVTPITNPPI